MSDDAQTGDTGQNGESTAPPTVGTETTESQGTEAAEATSGGTTTTEEAPAMVPSGRLREETAKRQGVEREFAEYREKAEAREAQPPAAPVTPTPQTIEDPPENLTPRERARWIVEQDAKQYIEGELGMSLKDARTLLSTSKTTAEDYAQRTWREKCAGSGLDPENREVAEMVSGLAKVGVSLDDAFSRASKVYGKQTQTETTGASVETTSQTGTMSGERIVPKDRQHAQQLAEKGVTIGHVSMHELIEGTVDDEKKQAGPQLIRNLN